MNADIYDRGSINNSAQSGQCATFFLLFTRHLHQLKVSLVAISFTRNQGLEALFVMAPFPPYDFVISPLVCVFFILL